MVDKIFYSWQSDASNTTNRNFIEDALFKAVKELGRSDDELYEPPRDVELDKDTKDVPGQPPIADTIFRKIEDCAVFVADMTFVSKTEAGRLSPNPNVLIEYGWALAKCGHRRIVTVMNTAHGEPNETKLPFDLRHYRWPIQYCVDEASDAKARAEEKKKLTKTLSRMIGDILKEAPSDEKSAKYTPIPHKSRVSSFLDDKDILCRHNPWRERKKAAEIYWHDGPQVFLRLIPEQAAEPKNPVQIIELAKSSQITPLGRVHGLWYEGNEWGAVVFEAKNEELQSTANCILQIGTYGEIWAIDGFSLRDVEAVPFDEYYFANKLGLYMKFATEQLGVSSDIGIVAGFSGVAGMSMRRPPLAQGYQYKGFEKTWGNAVRDEVFCEVQHVDADVPETTELEIPKECAYQLDDPFTSYAYMALIPCFEQIWGKFQLKRPEFLPQIKQSA